MNGETTLSRIVDAIDFIETHLQAAITVADMAAAVSYSVYYFCRTFNQATHHTPFDYMMRRRLAEAARAILACERKIIDIALDYQFNNPETFSRAFKRVFDTQPSQLRKDGRLDSRLLLPRLTPVYLAQIAEGRYPRPVLETLSTVCVAGIMTLIRPDRSNVTEVWALLTRLFEGQLPAGDRFGITYYPDDWEQVGCLYLAAIQAPTTSATNMALVTKTIPAQTVARFAHRGSQTDLQPTLDYVYHTWLPKSGRRLSWPMIIERYSVGDPPSDEATVYIPVA